MKSLRVLALRAASIARAVVLRVVPLRLRAVKAVVRRPSGEVLLVRHSYGDGSWMMPGGLVRWREPPARAVAREMYEELGIAAVEWRKLADYSQRIGLTRQSVAVFGTTLQGVDISPNHEIADWSFFTVDEPLTSASPATRRRLDELSQSGELRGGSW